VIYFYLTAGLLLLLVGGEFLVRGSVATATRAGVSPLLIGLTLVGFGTSTPELLTSVEAAMVGSPGIAVGNIIGSNIANILLILGISALICPLAVSKGAFYRDGSFAAFAALCGVAVCLTGELRPLPGFLLVAALVVYIVFCYFTERVDPEHPGLLVEPAAAVPGSVDLTLPVSITMMAGGLALTMLGAHLLVSSSLSIGHALGVSETVLGVTVVAIGTSLPELVTSVLAAIRRQPDIAFGNVVGSNIYNVLGILGITAIIEPIPVPPEIAAADAWIMLAATALLLLFSISGWRISRAEGGIFLAGYGAYLYFVTLS
jgi:cation:H+ antiporter